MFDNDSQRLIIFLFLMSGLLFVFFVFRLIKYLEKRNKRKLEELIREETTLLREEKEKLQVQKYLIETAKRDVTDSIHYAQRIQNAIIPKPSELKKWFREAFVLFIPRNIVSGDFYWISARQNKVFFAAVDCTGHGVPGAFMSVVGFALLEQLINGKQLNDPAQILLEMNDLVVDWLKQDRVEVNAIKSRDGMDMSLILWDKDTQTITFSGAKNPIFVARNGQEIEIIKADKFSIGDERAQEAHKTFSNHQFVADKDLTIYLSSDGFIDQFGGAQNKKFSKSRFAEELGKIAQLPSEQQHEHLHKTFHQWKGTYRQIDDIMVVGLKF
jgi:serine phosphatase RsbU (regulator of sigma subunit)